jgi:N-acetylmuramoyl-L-alanine amidase
MAEDYLIPEDLFRRTSWRDEIPITIISEHLLGDVYFKDNLEIQGIINDFRNREPVRKLTATLKDLNSANIDRTGCLKAGVRIIKIPSFDEMLKILPEVAHITNNADPIVIETEEKKKGVILLFRGHSLDNGPAENEVPIIISVFNEMNSKLTSKGYTVITDPQEDYPNGHFGIPARQRWIKNMEGKADIFIEIHANAGVMADDNKVIDPDKSGSETYYPQPRSDNPKSVYLAECVASAINGESGYKAKALEDSMSGQRSLGVLGGSQSRIEHNIPAIVFEAGYLTNPTEYALMQDKNYVIKLADLAGNGIDRYFIRYPSGVVQ